MSPARTERSGLVDVVAAFATALVGSLAAVATVVGGWVPMHALPPASVAAAPARFAPESQSLARSETQHAAPLSVAR